jgi:hypothetical protein
MQGNTNEISLGLDLLMNPKKRASGESVISASIASVSDAKDTIRIDDDRYSIKSMQKTKKGDKQGKRESRVAKGKQETVQVHKKRASSKSSASSRSVSSSSGSSGSYSDNSDDETDITESDDGSSEYSSSVASSRKGKNTKRVSVGESTDSSFSSMSSISAARATKKLTQEDIINMKKELIYQFDRMERKGLRVPKKFTLASSLEEMKMEYERIKADREVDISVKFQRKMMMAVITGVELMNNKFDPFDFKLDGWSESINESINDYDEIFEELYEKYKGKAKMAPELKLMFMVAGSAFMYHLTRTMFNNSIPGLENMMRQGVNTQHAQQQAPVRNGGGGGGGLSGLGGLGGLMGGLMGGGGGGLGGILGSLFSGGMPPMGGGSSAPPPPMGHRPQMRGPRNVEDILKEVQLNADSQNGADERIEMLSTISESEISDLPDDASANGVFVTNGKKKTAARRTLNI